MNPETNAAQQPVNETPGPLSATEPGCRAAHLKQAMRDKRIEYCRHITRHGGNMPDIREWQRVSK